MSRENVERLRLIYSRLSAGQQDHEDFELLDEAFEWRNATELPGASVHRGRQAVARELENQLDAWDELQFEPEQFIEVDGGVLVMVRATGRGRESGVPMERELAHLWSFRGELATKLLVYLDRDEALEAVGLRE